MNPAIDSLVRAMVANWPPVTRWQWTRSMLSSIAEPGVSWRARWSSLRLLVSTLRRWDDEEPRIRRMLFLANVSKSREVKS